MKLTIEDIELEGKVLEHSVGDEWGSGRCQQVDHYWLELDGGVQLSEPPPILALVDGKWLNGRIDRLPTDPEHKRICISVPRPPTAE